MAWLLHGDHVLATLEIADGIAGRARGLLGRPGIEGAMLLSPARSIHTVGMRFPIDAAWCDAEMGILRLRTLAPNRLPRPCLRARCVIEAEAGAFDRWGVVEGDVLDVHR